MFPARLEYYYISEAVRSSGGPYFGLWCSSAQAGIMNLLPIPAMDARLFFMVKEVIRAKRFREKEVWFTL
jgi:membrane-associated protease RseP (regulator of RpoE activity)